MTNTIFTEDELRRARVKKIKFNYYQVKNNDGAVLYHAQFVDVENKDTKKIEEKVLVKNYISGKLEIGDNVTVDKLKDFITKTPFFMSMSLAANSFSRYDNKEFNNASEYRTKMPNTLNNKDLKVISDRFYTVYSNKGSKVFDSRYIKHQEKLSSDLVLEYPKLHIEYRDKTLDSSYIDIQKFYNEFQNVILPSIIQKQGRNEVFINDSHVTAPNIDKIENSKGDCLYKALYDKNSSSFNVEYFSFDNSTESNISKTSENNLNFQDILYSKEKVIKSLFILNKENLNKHFILNRNVHIDEKEFNFDYTYHSDNLDIDNTISAKEKTDLEPVKEFIGDKISFEKNKEGTWTMFVGNIKVSTINEEEKNNIITSYNNKEVSNEKKAKALEL